MEKWPKVNKHNSSINPRADQRIENINSHMYVDEAEYSFQFKALYVTYKYALDVEFTEPK